MTRPLASMGVVGTISFMLAADAAAMYAELENADLRGEVARLERKLDAVTPGAKDRPR